MSIVIVRCQISSILECVAHHTPQGHSLQALCGQNKQERPGVHARICPLLLTARYVAHHLGLPARQEVGACCSHHPSGQFCKQCCTSCHQVESALGAERGSRYIRGCGVLLQLARATHSPPFLLPWCGRDASSDWGWPAPLCSWGHPAWPLRSQGTYTPPWHPTRLQRLRAPQSRSPWLRWQLRRQRWGTTSTSSFTTGGLTWSGCQSPAARAAPGRSR